MSSMGVAPSNTLSPNIAETRSQQDHWLCELSPVAPALPRSGGAGRRQARREARPRPGRRGGAARKWRTARPRRTGRNTATLSCPGRIARRDRGGRGAFGPSCRARQSAAVLPGAEATPSGPRGRGTKHNRATGERNPQAGSGEPRKNRHFGRH